MMARQILAPLLATFMLGVGATFGYGFYLVLRTAQPQRSAGRPSSGPALTAVELQTELQQAGHSLKSGKVEQAILAYRRVLAEVSSVEAHLGLADAELRAGREALAAREFERVLELDRRNPTALRHLGTIGSREPRTWALAEERYRAYLAVKPDDAEARLALARLLAWQAKSAAACEMYSDRRVAPLMTADDRRSYAFALAATGRTREAETLTRELLVLQPGDHDLTAQLAGMYAARREWKAAVPLYRSLVQRRPDDPRLQLAYGHGLAALGDTSAAVEPLGKAARAMPADADAGLAYARVLSAVGDADGSVREFERVLTVRPRSAAVRRELGDLLMERRNYGGAERHYRVALDLGLRDVRLLASLAGALDANGKPQEAVPLAEEAYARRPTSRLGFELAKLYQKVGRTRDAARLLQKIERDSGRDRPRG
jgi:tetratricopeptide (TPR) repeat protein